MCLYSLFLNIVSSVNPLKLETPKQVLWQTVKTQMKCRIMQHFIRVFTNQSSAEKNSFLEIVSCNPSIHTMDHPDLTESNFMENSIGPKGLKRTATLTISIFYQKNLYEL